MKIIIVDTNRATMNHMVRNLAQMYPRVQLLCADNAADTLDFPVEDVEIAFLDTDLPDMDGIELAKKMQERNERINIIFATDNDDYAREAYRIHASGYIMKPCTAETLKREMEDLRYPLRPQGLRFQCFGNFEVFFGEVPLHFDRKGSKEILAYLISQKGASVDRKGISKALWCDEEDIDKKKNYFRILISSLKGTLREYGAEDIFVTRRDSFAVDVSKIECDYYHYLKGEIDPSMKVSNGFMTQYAWAKDLNI